VILPHKSWNVWNADNKDKVARDERAHRQLLEAKEKCKRKTLQEIRYERLNGKVISKEEEEERIEYALHHMDINDYITDTSMREVAQNMNDRMQREEAMEEPHSNHNHNNRNKKHNLRDNKRKHRELDEWSREHPQEEQKYEARKRHKRNDISIIEDHYNEKSHFEFDPERYNKRRQQLRDDQRQKDNGEEHSGLSKSSNSHFSLFTERDLRNRENESGFKHQDVILEKREKKEMEEWSQKLGRTGIEARDRNTRPWYLMKSQQEMDRRMLMKSDEIQKSLPKRLKDYNRSTDELREKVTKTKDMEDPLNTMKKYLHECKAPKQSNSMVQEDSDDDEGDHRNGSADTLVRSIQRKRELKKQKKELLRKIKKDRKERMKRHTHRKHVEKKDTKSENDGDSDSDNTHRRRKKSKERKKKRKSKVQESDHDHDSRKPRKSRRHH